ncbi:long-chain-fatty-acid--CoA ligase [Corynebacterium flavescens]|uniref:Long-chain-fatty-acid--CoA ligase n=1 Tax=Corynebacterium flavescens TaxID=28028 RepID=A0A1L7CJJ4_CORFL|nr:long-chain-fatty-acid--CoA ligase [Corynebacterium flavescens]APT86034.1 long-chain fatty acid--CoA ligase [Corynebacterium flavescens]KAA8724702.1 long-chain fatty acid--CoA ligase [Corynebacterium flavescens]MDN6199629.1 long-chain fatty acid--CoA ligase [Corynebacterium flavescens]MDN6226657.1 long-chain fatty acid--CoA ligase [Corynebacterium flavescens]MDN6476172.1 long-chain fatty acid--CoA ligase [Corynebacterium flavescens]
MSAVDSKAWLQFYPEWTPHSLDYGETTLLDVYDNNLAINPDKPATYFFGRTQTFSDLDRQVRRAAAGLRAFGVRPGDRVAIVAPNCPQYVAAFYAILKLGAVAVLHNPLYTAHELEGLFKDHGARIAIAWDKTASTLEKLRGSTDLETVISINMIDAMPTAQRLALRLPFLKSTREQLSGEAPNTVPWDTLIGDAIGGDGKDLKNPPEVTKDTIAVIMYTSGTTGQPKGAQLSHGNFFAVILQGKNWVPGLGDRPERMLAALPFFHAYGLTMNVVLQPLIGGELVIIPKPDIALIMKLMKKHTPTWIPGVPTLYQRIVEAAEKDGVDIKGVRAAFSGASTLPVDTVEKWEKYTGGLLVEGYGLTECSPIIVGNPMTTDRRPGYVGIPFPDTEVRIANPDNLDETQPDGTAGEVLARGHQVFKGYLNNPEATAAAFHNGWFRTGDMGIMDSDGFIRLVSRIKEIIITGGFNVYPGEVEEVLRTHPSIDDVAVVGRPRPDGSEDVVACIDLSDGAALDPEGLKDFCRERLTRYKVPRTFYHFQELPKDQMGKIRRREVQAALLERLAAEEKH